jgi:hypothetical protein
MIGSIVAVGHGALPYIKFDILCHLCLHFVRQIENKLQLLIRLSKFSFAFRKGVFHFLANRNAELAGSAAIIQASNLHKNRRHVPCIAKLPSHSFSILCGISEAFNYLRRGAIYRNGTNLF